MDSRINTESLWFRTVVVFATLFFTIIFIINAYFYNKARINVGSVNGLSQSEATTLLWVNIILAIISIILFIWGIIRLFFSPTVRRTAQDHIKQFARDKAIAVANYTKGKAEGAQTVLQSESYVVGSSNPPISQESTSLLSQRRVQQQQTAQQQRAERLAQQSSLLQQQRAERLAQQSALLQQQQQLQAAAAEVIAAQRRGEQATLQAQQFLRQSELTEQRIKAAELAQLSSRRVPRAVPTATQTSTGLVPTGNILPRTGNIPTNLPAPAPLAPPGRRYIAED